MDAETRTRLAKALRNNALFRVLFNERRAEITADWQAESDAETREQLWRELHALTEFEDYCLATINEKPGDGRQ